MQYHVFKDEILVAIFMDKADALDWVSMQRDVAHAAGYKIKYSVVEVAAV